MLQKENKLLDLLGKDTWVDEMDWSALSAFTEPHSSAVLEEDEMRVKPPYRKDIPAFGESQWMTYLPEMKVNKDEAALLRRVGHLESGVKVLPLIEAENVSNLKHEAETVETSELDFTTSVESESPRKEDKKKRYVFLWWMALAVLLGAFAFYLFTLYTNADRGATPSKALETTIIQPRGDLGNDVVPSAVPIDEGAQKENDVNSSAASGKTKSATTSRSNGREQASDVPTGKHQNKGLSDYDCALITGAFSEDHNVERMIDKLQSEGHKVYTEIRNDLTLVGVYHRRSDYDLRQEIRALTTEDAWIMDFD